MRVRLRRPRISDDLLAYSRDIHLLRDKFMNYSSVADEFRADKYVRRNLLSYYYYYCDKQLYGIKFSNVSILLLFVLVTNELSM